MRAERDKQRPPLLLVGHTTPKIACSDWGAGPHPIHVFWPTRVSVLKRHLDRFSRFCRAHERDQQTVKQTDKHTDHAAAPVAVARILGSACDVT